MNYLKIKLKSGKMAYAIREYFPYTDKPFFKSLDDILVDEALQVSLAHLFVQLYKDELVFLYENITNHEYIVPIKHESNKFTKINNIICSNIAKLMGIKILDDYFDVVNIPRVDIRDDYTKEEHNIEIKINKKYHNIPVIIFDCCCSTGKIFSSLFSNLNNVYLTYGVRFQATELNNTDIIKVEEYEFNSENYDLIEPGYYVRIYGLFGDKKVEVDFRNAFSISIGENGYGKSTSVKLALLALQFLLKPSDLDNKKIDFLDIEFDDDFNNEINDNILNSDEGLSEKELISTMSKYYFEKIEVYYSDYYYNCNENIDKCNDDLDNSHVVSFLDNCGYCFYKQIVKNNEFINIKELSKFNLESNKYISEFKNLKISKDLEIHIKDFKFDYQMLKKVGSLASSLKNTIFYSDVIPSKQDILKSYENVILEKFFSTINDMEYQTIIRKIIVQDRTIEIEYKDLEMKYQYSFDFSIIDKLLREYFVNRLETENAYYLKYFEFDEYGENKICDGYNDSDPNKEYNKNFINLFNCTKSRNIIPKLARDRFKLDIFAGNEDSQKEFEEEINLEYEEYLTDYNENFGYDLFEGQVNKNLFKVEAIVNSIEKQLCCKIYEIDKIQKFFNENIFSLYHFAANNYSNVLFNKTYKKTFEDNNFILHDILYSNFLNKKLKTNLYSILNKLFDYDKVDFSKTRKLCIYTLEDSLREEFILKYHYEPNIYINIDGFLTREKINIINKVYNYVFNENYNVISLGIYDMLNDESFNLLSSIIKRIRSKGICSINDYLVVIGLKMLIDSYKTNFISKKHILLEKLLNKYLINKNAYVYADTIIIEDLNKKFIPIDYLSTGEKNIIILFTLCLSHNNELMILDEPDLSMSVEWQSKILVDLLKYTNNKYFIISQSPMLIQKNNLSTFVKRMDFNDCIKIVEFMELKKLLEVVRKNINHDFDEFNLD